MRSAVSGDFSEGFSTIELPVASAGPSFQDAMISGKFQGTIAATTPTGSRVISASVSCDGRRDLVVHLVDRLGVPGDAVGGRRDVDVHASREIGLPMSSVSSERQLLAVLADQLGEAQQHLLARGRRAPRPGAALEGLARARDGEFDVRRVAGGDLRDHLAVRRVDAVEGRAGDGRHVLAVDEGLRARLQRLGQRLPVDGLLFTRHGDVLKASVGSKR